MANRVAYFYDSMLYSHQFFLAEVGSYYYGAEHPMKPFRIKMAH